MCLLFVVFFFFKQKTAYEMRISDWSSDVCSSDLFSSQTLTQVVREDIPNTKMTKKLLLLFDVDGTLTLPRLNASDEMKKFLLSLKGRVTVEIGRASCRERVCQYV